MDAEDRVTEKPVRAREDGGSESLRPSRDDPHAGRSSGCTCRKGARCLTCIDADGLTRGHSLAAILHRIVRRVLAGAA